MVTPLFGNTTCSEFVPGDSILNSTSLLGVWMEMCEIYTSGVRSYNVDNGSAPMPIPDNGGDRDTGDSTFAATIPYRSTVNLTTGKVENIAANYIDAYVGWVEPTSGNLAGVKSFAEAMIIVHGAIKYQNSQIEAGSTFQDFNGRFTVQEEDETDAWSITSSVGRITRVNSTTGAVETIVQDHFVFTLDPLL
jgi:hypothetical protein